jgi:hypothetical protein
VNTMRLPRVIIFDVNCPTEGPKQETTERVVSDEA